MDEQKAIDPDGESTESPAAAPDGPESPGPSGASGEESAPADSGSEGESDLTLLRAKAEERDRFLEELRRARADYENLRRRVREERPHLEDQGKRSVLGDLLEILDNFDRALASLGEPGGDGLAEGVRMIHHQLVGVLESHGVSEIPAENQPFDPEVHSAVTQCVVEDLPSGQIVAVLQKGYAHGGAVLRPASVQVSHNPGASESDEAGSEASDPDGQAPEAS